MYVPVPKYFKGVFLANIDLSALNGHNGQDSYKKIGPTSISTKKCQYIVLEVWNPFTFISMVKSQTSCHINQRLFTRTS